MAGGITARQQKVGIRKATTWGTALAVGVGNGYYLSDDYRDEAQVNVSPHDSAGLQFINEQLAANNKSVVTTLPMFLLYADAWQNLLWALTLGGAGGAPVKVGSTTAYRNHWDAGIGGAFTGKMATIVRDKSIKIVELSTVKFTGFTITVGTNGRLQIAWDVMSIGGTESSVINTATQTAALTYPPDGMRSFLTQATLRLNVQSGSSLATPTDVMNCTGFQIKFTQPFDQRYIGGSGNIIEPEDNGRPTIELMMTFGRLDNAAKQFTTWQLAQTPLKADLTIVGPNIESGFNNQILISMPHLQVTTNSDPLPGAGTQSAPSATLTGLSASSAPSGMSGITVPIRVEVTGTQTVDPLA